MTKEDHAKSTKMLQHGVSVWGGGSERKEVSTSGKNFPGGERRAKRGTILLRTGGPVDLIQEAGDFIIKNLRL